MMNHGGIGVMEASTGSIYGGRAMQSVVHSGGPHKFTNGMCRSKTVGSRHQFSF